MKKVALGKRATIGDAVLGEGQAQEQPSFLGSQPIISLEEYPIGLYTTTFEGDIIEANQALVEILEAPDKKMLLESKSTDLYVNLEDRRRLLNLLTSTTQVRNFEIKMRTFKGRTIWVNISARLIREDGRAYIRGALQDITALHYAQQALTETEAKFRAISELAPDAVIILDLQGHITFWNKAAEKIFGYKQSEIVGKNLHTLLANTRYTQYYQRALKQLREGKDRLSGKCFRLKAQRKNGDIFPVAISHNLIQIDHHPVLLCNIRDVSAEERAKAHIKKREEILKALSYLAGLFLQNIPFQQALNQAVEQIGNLLNLHHIVVYQILEQKKGNFLHIQHIWHHQKDKNENFFTNEDAVLLKSLLLPPTHQDVIILRVSALSPEMRHLLLRRGAHTLAISPIFVAEKCWGFIEFANEKEKNWSNVELYALRTLTNILGVAIQRELFSEELIKEKEQLDITLASIADGVIVTDTYGHILLINQGAQKILKENINPKEKEICVQDIFTIFYEKTKQPENIVESVLQHKRTVRPVSEVILKNKKGKKIPIQIVASPIKNRERQVVGVVIIFQDITRRKQLEQEIIQQEKTKILEMLAGGVAHDFNNLLVAILGNISLAKLKNKQSHIDTYLHRAQKAARQAEKLTRQLLTFTKGGIPVKRTTSIAELLHETVSFIVRGSNVKIRFNIPQGLWPVQIDEVQISQVIQNLVINAQQAMPEGGTIEVIAQNLEIKEDSNMALPPGPYIKLTVKDDGCGIPPENLARIFDPYFTTKKEGTGLGLAVVYSIIKKHQGHIRVHSILGRGSSFEIYLPAEKTRQVPEKTKAPPSSLSSPGSGLPARILILDDEKLILDTLSEMLSLMGYEVDTALEGLEAVEKYRKALEKGKPFDLIIMDLTIPGGIGGKEAIQEILKIDPQAKAVVSTGYSSNQIISHYQEYGFKGVLKKPYCLDELKQLLERLIPRGR